MKQLLPDVVVSTMRTGFFLEVPVTPECAPFLVSGTKSLLWLPAAHRGVVRTAIRPGGLPEDAYEGIVREVQAAGTRALWANGFPATPEGLEAAQGHLRDYGIDSQELLVAPGEAAGYGEDLDVGVEEAPWVPSGKAVLVPADRHYLGMVLILKGAYAIAVHNPSRGMAVLGSW